MCAALERKTKPVSADLQKRVMESLKKRKLKKLEKLLPSVLNLEFRNEEGKTPLYIACENNEEAISRLLLNYSADPNARSTFDNSTPVLVTGTVCSMKIMEMLINRGGDLRLHDFRGRGIRDYVKLNRNHMSQRLMLSYLDQKQKALKAFIATEAKKPGGQWSRPPDLERAETKPESVAAPQFGRCTVTNLGFGKVFYEDEVMRGLIGLIPIVTEPELSADSSSVPESSPVGKFMEIKSQLWGMVQVSVKEVSGCDSEAWVKDLLLNECKFMKLVRHPSILVLMGVCIVDPANEIRLVYERVQPISLFGLLHDQQHNIRLDIFKKNKIMKQVASALLYIHQRKLLHRSISSRAVYLAKNDDAKLGNFEYMIERCDSKKLEEQSQLIRDRYLSSGYQWMAREVILGQSPSQQTDIYSLCVVIWEMLHEKKPFADLSLQEVKNEINRATFQVTQPTSPTLGEMLKYGLSKVARDRPNLVTIMNDLDTEWKFQRAKLRNANSQTGTG